MFNRTTLTSQVLAVCIASAGFLANGAASAAEARCSANFDFLKQTGKDVSGTVEWRARRGGLVDVEFEARPSLNLADKDIAARVSTVNSAGDPVRMRCTFVDGALPGDDDVCEVRRANRGNLINARVQVDIPGVGRQVRRCILE